ncbi:MAG: hypothetical protein JXX14_04800 [Deltaproteobacteria bacterium]|nr:hypothetical protein [Deltaproteobacteria bacterium]
MNYFKPMVTRLAWLWCGVFYLGGCDYVTEDVNEQMLTDGPVDSMTDSAERGGTDTDMPITSGTDSAVPQTRCDPLTAAEGLLCDGRDGNTYATVQVGDSVWMAENLNFALPGSACYGFVAENCETYGRLYSWSQAMLAENAPISPYEEAIVPGDVQVLRGVCPADWHLPSKGEWEALRRSILENYPDNTEADALKSTSGWPANQNGLNLVGLNILPAGWHLSGEILVDLGESALFWGNPNGYVDDLYDYGNKPVYLLDHEADALELTYFFHTDLASVRCVKDAALVTDTDSDSQPVECAPNWDVTSINTAAAGATGECCTTGAEALECLLADAADEGLTCTADDLSNCAVGQSCSEEGLCTCTNSCHCGAGRCSTMGVCLPSTCNGYYVCSCWGGCTWWDPIDSTATPADDAAALNMYCCDGYTIDGTPSLLFSVDPSCQ